jgi:hypothetical protein
VVVGALLSHAIDYAGLFPPAQLDMPGAVAEYASYVASPDSWALGRFVVPASRLTELLAVASDLPSLTERSLGSEPWDRCLCAVLGADLAADVDRVTTFNADHQGDAPRWWNAVEAVELRAGTADAIGHALRTVPTELERFVEIPIEADPTPLVRAIRSGGGMAKVRTGGTAGDAFPSSEALVRFLAACVAEGVPFKATAGLHHPIRGDYRLTYERDSATGRMYGFLNVFIATAFLRAGMAESTARAVLEEQDPNAISFDGQGVRWREHELSVDQLLAARGVAIQSFGSCSFREPIDDLTAIGIL